MHPPWEMTIDRQRSSTFLMYMLLHDVGEDYWSISYFFYNIFLTRRDDYLSIFFLSRQTWLRGPHAAPTIEDYWPIFFFIAYSSDPGACIRRCMYAHNVRACTLYVGQQVCACLHPVRGVYREDEYVRACTLYAGQQACACLHPVRGS